MPFQPVPDCAHVRITMLTGELDASINLAFAKPGFVSADLATLIDHLEANFLNSLKPAINGNYTFEHIYAWDLSAVDGYKSEKDISIAGTGSGNPVSPALATVVSFYGNKRGKWNQGRNFLPGLGEDHVDQTDIQAVITTGIRGAYETLITNPPTGWQWVVVSRYLNGAKRTNGVYIAVESVVVRSGRFGVQRRRTDRP
jgi:hypothetical protein